jgi:hypothetical protein
MMMSKMYSSGALYRQYIHSTGCDRHSSSPTASHPEKSEILCTERMLLRHYTTSLVNHLRPASYEIRFVPTNRTIDRCPSTTYYRNTASRRRTAYRSSSRRPQCSQTSSILRPSRHPDAPLLMRQSRTHVMKSLINLLVVGCR